MILRRPTTRFAASALLVPAGFALTLVLSGCMPPSHAPSPAPSTSPSASASASPSASAPSPTPSVTVTTTLSAADIDNIESSISSGNTAALEQYLTTPVHIAFAASDLIQDDTPDQAIGILNDNLATATGWSWTIPATTLSAWRASSSYGAWFPDGAIIGHASSGAVISFIPAGVHVSGIYVALSDSLLTGG